MYVLIMLRYVIVWNKIPDWKMPADFHPSTKITILIPARNEAENIQACVESILQQNYPKQLLQIIIIDDHSTDNTATIVQNIKHTSVQLLPLAQYVSESETQSFKKKALEIAMQQATGELILTTDADCITPKDWLGLIVSYYESKQVKFIAAPVNFYDEQNALERFQSLDFIGMMGITGAGIHGQFMNMCNGANLAYPKAVFQEVNGFEGINHLASGDDMLLMQKIAAIYPDQIGYIKNPKATVVTKAKPTWKSFLQQRIRWTTKSAGYKEWKVTVTLALVFFFCCSIVLNLGLAFFIKGIFMLVLLQLGAKTLLDFILLRQMSQYFNRMDLMKTFGVSSIYHLVYIVVVGILGNLKKEYEWKGRKTR